MFSPQKQIKIKNWILIIQIIVPIYKREDYQINNVIKYIEQNYPKFKYYGTYYRKNSISISIFRFYIKLKNGKKITLSVLPAFLFSRKQKSLTLFFKLLEILSKNNITIKKLWSFFENENHFKDIRTLRQYFNKFFLQLDKILITINDQLSLIKGHTTFETTEPADKETDLKNQKLQTFFQFLDEFVGLFKQDDGTNKFSKNEKYQFIHFFLFQQNEIILLNTS